MSTLNYNEERYLELLREIDEHNVDIVPCDDGLCSYDVGELELVGTQESTNSHEGAEVTVLPLYAKVCTCYGCGHKCLDG